MKYSLEEIKQMLGKITQGEWEVSEWNDDYSVETSGGEAIATFTKCYPECSIGLDRDDAKFIAASPSIIKGLIERIEELEKENEAWIEDLDTSRNKNMDLQIQLRDMEIQFRAARSIIKNIWGEQNSHLIDADQEIQAEVLRLNK